MTTRLNALAVVLQPSFDLPGMWRGMSDFLKIVLIAIFLLTIGWVILARRKERD